MKKKLEKIERRDNCYLLSFFKENVIIACIYIVDKTPYNVRFYNTVAITKEEVKEIYDAMNLEYEQQNKQEKPMLRFA